MAIPGEIWVEKMREISSKMTDLACLGRSTKLLERWKFFDFAREIRFRSQKDIFIKGKNILNEFAVFVFLYFLNILREGGRQIQNSNSWMPKLNEDVGGMEGL